MGSKEVRAGKGYIELGLRDKIGKGLKAAEAKLRGFGQSAAKIGGATALTAGGFLAPLLMAASDAQETSSKFETVFAGRADAVRKWGDEFAGQVGRSKNEVAGFLSNTQDLLVPLGIDPGSAEAMSKQLTTLAVDLASFNNMQDADVMRDLQAAITGETDGLKKYGVVANEAAIKQELLNQGMDPKNINAQQKAMAIMAITMRGTTAAQGDATRTAGGFANQLKRAWAVGSDLAVVLGEHLLPPATMVLSAFSDGVQWVGKFAEENAGLAKIIVGGVAVVGILGGVLFGVGAAATVASIGLGLVGGGLAMVGSVVGMLFGPVGAVLAILAGVAFVAYRNRDALLEFAGAWWDTLAPVRDAAAQIWAIVSDTFGAVTAALGSGDYAAAASVAWTGIQAVFWQGAASAADAFRWLFDTTTNAISGLLPAFETVFGFVRETIGGIADALAAGEIQLAAQILWASLMLVWTEGTSRLSKVWAYFAEGLAETWDTIATAIVGTFEGVVFAIADMVLGLTSEIRDLLMQLAEYDPTGATEAIARQLGAVASIRDLAAAEGADRADERERARNERRVARYKATTDAIAAADQSVADRRAARDQLLAQAAEARAKNGMSLSDRAASKLAELKDQTAAIEASTEDRVADGEAVDNAESAAGDGMKKAASSAKSQTAGTFSGVAASLLGLGGQNDVAQRTEKNTERTARATEKVADAVDKLQPAFG